MQRQTIHVGLADLSGGQDSNFMILDHH